MGSLTNFAAHVKKHGLSNPSRFKVTIPLPKKLQKIVDSNYGVNETGDANLKLLKTAISVVSTILGGSNDAVRGLQFMTQNAKIPGINLDTSESNTHGNTRKIAYDSTVDNMDITFFLSKDMYEKTIIDEWINLAVDRQKCVIGYYDDYVTDITVDTLDSADSVMYSRLVVEAYPVMITSIDLDKSMVDSFATMNVSFAFREVVPPENAIENSLLGGTAVGKVIENISNGNITEAIVNSAEIFAQVQAGNFTGLAADAYKMVTSVLKDNVGLSLKDLKNLYDTVKSGIKLNKRLSTTDKNNLVALIEGIVERVS